MLTYYGESTGQTGTFHPEVRQAAAVQRGDGLVSAVPPPTHTSNLTLILSDPQTKRSDYCRTLSFLFVLIVISVHSSATP